MLLPPHEFAKPSSLAASLALLKSATGEVKLLAGGTDVIFNMRARLFQPKILLSIRELPELQEVFELADGSLSMGACRGTGNARGCLCLFS